MTLIRSTYSGRLSSPAPIRSHGRAHGEGAARGDHGSPRRAAVGYPGLMTRIHNLREVRADQEVYQQNANWSDGILARADGALQDSRLL